MTNIFHKVDDISSIALNILRKRYFKDDENRWEDLVNRVIKYVLKDSNEEDVDEVLLTTELINNRYFIPNSPCLVNANTKNNGLSACYVVDFNDSIEEIYKTKLEFALIAKKGGGCGTTLTKLRPEGDKVSGSTHGYSGGPIKFFDTICYDMEIISQGGFRSMAMMGTISCNHPDIIKFIKAKEDEKRMTTANLSVMIDNEFMERVINDEYYWTHFGNKKYDKLKARDVFNLIVEGAWRNGEPGILFKDKINSNTPYKYTGQEILSTNPCSEQSLPKNGNCTLGSLDISKFLNEDLTIDLLKLELATRLGIRFLDSTIDVNNFPTRDIHNWAIENRAIGLGIMGLADYYLKRKVVYGSDQSLEELEFIMNFIYKIAEDESITLGEKLGIPKYCKYLPSPRRNITLLSLAPTGTLSILAGCSGGIEPVFSEITTRKDETGTYQLIHKDFDKDYFRCAVSSNGIKEVSWQEHLKVLNSAQKFVDSGTSKCIEKGTLIPTDGGLIKIEDFSDVETDDTFVDISEKSLFINGNKIINHYKAGFVESTEIRLDNGVQLVGATKTHKVLTSKGWEILGNLSIGDIVLGSFKESHGDGNLKIEWKDVLPNNANKIYTPKNMTEEFAQFIGMISSDGHMAESTGYVGISCKNNVVEEEFKRICFKVFGVHPKETVDKRNGVKSLYITSRNLSRFMISFIGNGAYNKYVPNQILMGNKKEKLAYLKGISLDGYIGTSGKVEKKKTLCIYGGMSEDLAYGTAEICRSFGIPKVYQGTKDVKGFGTCHLIVVSNELHGIIKCIETHKNVDRCFIDYNVYVPRNIIENTKVKLSHKRYYALKDFSLHRDQNREYCFSNTAKDLGWDTNILAHKITSVTDVGKRELFDIEVENDHDYIVNGIVSHNTVNCPKGTRKETVYNIFLDAWKSKYIKGLTVYRNGSRDVEVLSPKNIKKDKCPICESELIRESGCKRCSVCEFSLCSI